VTALYMPDKYCY